MTETKTTSTTSTTSVTSTKSKTFTTSANGKIDSDSSDSSDSFEFDYEKLGLMVGLEIHQQLDTKEKLHCSCSNTIRDESDSNFEFFRYLRPKSGISGVIDPAAVEQTMAKRPSVYKGFDSVCLGEMDEEAPLPLNSEALETALVVSKMFNMVLVDKVYVMRKIIVDGSSPTGFQRTSFISGSGSLKTESGTCRIATMSLEEDSATSLGSSDEHLKYSLDRLGIPLIEVATYPDMKTPSQVYEVASEIGMIFRSTGKVKRGIGTIRQDVNVSISDGARVEIKGVQALDMIEEIVKREVLRQVSLLKLREDLLSKKASVPGEIFDVTEVFSNTKSKVLQRGMKNGCILATVLKGFNGFVGREVQPGRRLGSELSDKAKAVGVSGLFHTDELPNYGITKDDVNSLRNFVNADSDDAVIFMAGNEFLIRKAMDLVIERARYAFEGVPGETRYAQADGNTSYLRPLPGPARMFPETDILPVCVKDSYFKNLPLPELLNEKADRFMKEYNLNREFAEQLAYSYNPDGFEKIAKKFVNSSAVTPTFIARNMTGTKSELKRGGTNVDYLTDEIFEEAFDLVDYGKISKESLIPLFEEYCKTPNTPLSEIVSKKNLSVVDLSEVEEFIIKLVNEKKDFIKEKQNSALGPLMGPVMGEFRGRVDGKDVSRLLKQEIDKILNS